MWTNSMSSHADCLNTLCWYMEITQVSIDRWMDKENVVYIQLLHYLALKKKEILTFVTTWLNLKDIILSEISQTQKSKYCMISLVCGI